MELPLPQTLVSRCPACACSTVMPLFDAGSQPLATLAFPESREEAERLPRYPLRFVRCIDCGHVFNPEFDYDQVPYSKHPNKMFNLGAIWRDHLRHVKELILQAVSAEPAVVEIGCGDGHLLRALAAARPGGRYVGFDPNAEVDTGGGAVEARQELFRPARHLVECRPEIIVARHVLEHLLDPLDLLKSIAFAASWLERRAQLFVEVPCVDLAIETCRTADFYYEHNSHFTSKSLQRLLERAGAEIELLEKGYGGEVVYALAALRPCARHRQIACRTLAFASQARQAARTLAAQLDAIARSGRRVAIWGGTGKAAALINQCRMDARRFPLVVDSDPQKVGTFVPGTGQQIRFRDELIEHPAEVIIIATQWRAGDIVLEMREHGIACETVLIEHQGRLIDYHRDDHPYRQAPGQRVRVHLHAPVQTPNFLLTSDQFQTQ